MSEVQYKIVAGSPGYRIGTDGTIWSRLLLGRIAKGGSRLDGKKWRKLSPKTNCDGYKIVMLCRVDKRVIASIHRIVLEAFVGRCPPGNETRHLDGDPSNNNLNNLAWGTSSENSRDSISHGTHDQRGQKNGNVKLTESQAIDIRKRARNGELQRVLASEFGIERSTVGYIKNGRRWPHLAEIS